MTDLIIAQADLQALWLSVKLATTVTFLLLCVGTPLAWWLADTRQQGPSRFKTVVKVVVTLPLVLPPTVLGFYLLIFLGPESMIGRITQTLGIGLLPFTFSGLVVASMLYSLPFMVQPLQSAFSAIERNVLETAAVLGASPMDRFFSVVVPLCKPSFIAASVLTFAHTVGEFGVILMIGGSIPNETRVVSVQIFDHVEGLAFAQAHVLSAVMLVFSFAVLLGMNLLAPNAGGPINAKRASKHAD